MTNGDVGAYGPTKLSQSDAQLYQSVGTTSSEVDTVDLSDVAEATVSGKVSDQQPNLWLIGDGPRNLTNFQAFYSQPLESSIPDRWTSFSPPAFFTSSIPVGTDTGILQAFALRLNTSLNCEEIPQSNFPASCHGTAPFTANYSNADLPEAKADFYGGPIFTFRACAPGNFSWVQGKNTQEISEELYINLQSWRSPAKYNLYNAKIDTMASIVSNFSYHCTANSTLAFFEPPNYWNGHQVQDIVELGPENANYPTGPNLPLQRGNLNDPVKSLGPFSTSILAIFGKNTFFDNIANANDTHNANLEICQALRMPLTGLCTGNGSMCTPYKSWEPSHGPVLDCITPGGDDPSNPNTDHQHPNGTLAYYLFLFLQKFNNLNSTTAALTLTNFYSSQAILDPSKALDSRYFEPFEGRVALSVYASPGLGIQKLHVPLAGLIIISVLIILQLAGLFSLAVYASAHATWTGSLDSFALLRLGAAMADELPLISALDAKELPVLDEREGWVGDAGGAEKVRMLRIGGEECAKKDTPYRSVAPGRTIRLRKEFSLW